MQTYQVTLPITGIIVTEVEANSEEEAIEAAFGSDLDRDNIEEWIAHREIVQGNVFYGHTNKASAEEV